MTMISTPVMMEMEMEMALVCAAKETDSCGFCVFLCTSPVTDSTPLGQAILMLAHFMVHAKNGRWVACNAALEMSLFG